MRTPGLQAIHEEPGYAIYEETNSDTTKDTSLMQHPGLVRFTLPKSLMTGSCLFLIKFWNTYLKVAPLICESPSLRNLIEPGVFIIMSSKTTNKRKNINNLQLLPHVMFKLEELADIPHQFLSDLKMEGGSSIKCRELVGDRSRH